jgi:hypothetical protein
MDFTFTAIDLGITDNDRKNIYDEVMSADEKHWHYNDFRGCYMLPVYNAGGVLGGQVEGRDTRNGMFNYTEAMHNCSFTKKFLEEKIFPWMEPQGRVTILRTPAGKGLNVHLDSTEDEIGTLQHKFRIVLNGKVDKLFFIDKNHNKVYIPDNYSTYILDGSHPHSLEPADEVKITLCIGAPWTGQPTKEYEELVNNSLYTMKVSRPDRLEKSWTDPFWKK